MKEMTEARKEKRGAKAAVGVLCVLLVLAVAYGGLCAYASGGRFYANTGLNGMAIGGLTVDAAQKMIEETLPVQRLTLTDAENGAVLREVTLAELGYTAEAFEGFAAQQLAELTDVPFLSGGADWLRAMAGEETSVYGWPEVDAAAQEKALERLAEELSEAPVEGSWALAGDVIRITCPREGRSVTADDLRQLTDTALFAEGKAAIARKVVAVEMPDAQTIYDALISEKKEAVYDKETDSVSASATGVSFELEDVRKALESAVAGAVVEVSAEVDEPKVTSEELESLLFRDVLGECHSTVTGEDGRVTNVRLSAEAINGHIMNPGESFSYNQVVGKRTKARGYQEGPAYVNGKTVMEIGGGICQTSSTLYLACLRANLKITDRTNHGYVPAYVPWGMDSAVSWGTLDYCFVNNTDYPIKIVTSFDGNELDVKLLGTNLDGRYAEVTFEVLSTKPWTTTEYVEDPALEPGSEGVVMVEPYTGAKVRTTHIIYDADGNVLDSHYEATSNYKMRNRVIHVPVGEIPVEADS